MNETLSRENAKSISHLDIQILFCQRPMNEGSYFEVKKQIESSGLITPVFSEVISLIDHAWKNPEEKFSKEIIALSNDLGIWAYTGILFLPKEGVYIEDHPQVEGSIFHRAIKMDRVDLEKKLASEDKKVRFIKWGQKTVSKSSEDEVVLALAGVDGAKKYGEIKTTRYGLSRAGWSMEHRHYGLTQPRRFYPCYRKGSIYFYPEAASEDDWPASGYGILPKTE
ncbi:MAG: hypothetical protein Q7S27_07100 [Nanoarchaeota archaeon]|nr:hypothetical protein [Nanoarchaeota archaeon]